MLNFGNTLKILDVLDIVLCFVYSLAVHSKQFGLKILRLGTFRGAKIVFGFYFKVLVYRF